eukprot:1395207-Amphidinium_carterae.2
MRPVSACYMVSKRDPYLLSRAAIVGQSGTIPTLAPNNTLKPKAKDVQHGGTVLLCCPTRLTAEVNLCLVEEGNSIPTLNASLDSKGTPVISAKTVLSRSIWASH